MSGQHSGPDNGIIKNQDEAVRKLVDLLRKEQAILVVGAGISRFVGYPLLNELLEMMRNRFAPERESPINKNYDRTKFASKITQNADKTEYFKFLESTFGPKRSMIDDLQLSLVRLKFKGILTTNYDVVLENAIYHELNGTEIYNYPDSIDLCDIEKSWRVSKFLRSISEGRNLSDVLHINGYFKNPEKLILTEDDYRRYYGDFNVDGEQMQVPLDRLHRKVIWALLAMYSVVFIGFDIKKDPIFIKMLDIVKNDLKRHGECLHYAILPSTDIESEKYLIHNYCVQPIFYNVIEDDDHDDLRRLIFELENMVKNAKVKKDLEPCKGLGIKDTKSEVVESEIPKSEIIKSPSLNEINKKMLEI